MAHVVRTYDHDPAAESYGLEAAAALGLDPAVVFKTLVVELDASARPARYGVAIVPVADRLDRKAMAAVTGVKKVAMVEPATAERLTGYVTGGISPLGQKSRLTTVLDASAADYDLVYVSGGRRGLDVGIAPADLVVLTDGTLAEIRRPG